MKKEICNFLIVLLGLSGFYFLLNFQIISCLSCIVWIGIIYYFKQRIIKKERQNSDSALPSSSHIYKNSARVEYIKKNIMTDCEWEFFNKFRVLENEYIIIPQLNLASVIHKTGAKYCSELFRNVDFAIFDKDYNLLLLIELNDKSHTSIKRKDRDLKVKKILSDCQIPLLTFYTYYPNEKQYVLNRISKALNEIKSKSN